MKEKLKFPGVPVYMNGRNYYIPSLSTRQYRENASTLEKPPLQAEGESPISFVGRLGDELVPIIGIAIRRNYPEVSDDDLADWLDGTTLMTAWQATQNASGMTPVTEGEELPAPEVPTGPVSTVA